MDHQKFFRLEEGEKIVENIKPLPILKWYMFFRGGVIGSFILIVLGFFFVINVYLPSMATDLGAFPILNLYGFLLLVLFVVIPLVTSHLRYNKQHYWITNKRVIYKRGMLGYKISSIPLERISDIIITRSFWETLFGFGSIHIQSMAGQFSGGYRGGYARRGYRPGLGAEGSLLAIPNPEGLQKLVFELIKKKRKSEKLTM